MPDAIDGRWPKLEQAQQLLVEFLTDHPNMTNLAVACGPFFDWMKKHDNDPNATKAAEK